MKNAYKIKNGDGSASYYYKSEEGFFPVGKEIYSAVAQEERKEKYQRERDRKKGVDSLDDPNVATRIGCGNGGRDVVFKTVLARCILRMLPREERAVVFRRACKRMSALETARDLGISESTVRRTYRRAVERARCAFSEEA